MENLSVPMNMDLVRSVAMINPRLAYMLVRGHALIPKSYSLGVSFPAANEGQKLQGSLQERLFQDAWILGFKYTIRRKNAFTGNIFKEQSDYYCVKQPYIDVFIRINGEDKYEITNSYQPLELLCNDNNVFSNAWVITRDQDLIVDFVLKRALFDNPPSNTEVPYDVTLVINTYQLSGCNFRSVDYTESLCALRQLGVCPNCEGVGTPTKR